jgi:hypothetical protein
MIKHALTAAALAAALASPAFAQDKPVNKSATTQGMPAQNTADRAGFVQNQHATDWRGSKLIGAIVYGPDNASIGDVNDVLLDNSGKIRAVVIGVGGFLGVGEKNVAVPFDALAIARKPGSSVGDKLKSMNPMNDNSKK